MPASYRVLTTPAFDRSIKRLAKKHRDIPERFEELITVLQHDPLNVSHKHNIKKAHRHRARRWGMGH